MNAKFVPMRSIAIIGCGPAGLMAGYQLLKRNHSVSFFDQKKAIARKFLVAGHGGFNLTNSLELENFLLKYDHEFVRNAVRKFTNNDTVSWLAEIGIETYIGSSGKVFPKSGIKPIEVLSAWIKQLEKLGGIFKHEHQLKKFDGTILTVESLGEIHEFHFDTIIFALGGASWKQTGSDGNWMKLFESAGISCLNFESSNAGMEIHNWNQDFGGSVLKNCEIKLNGMTQFGEVECTNYGIEGAPVYALNHPFREGFTNLSLDLKPKNTVADLFEKLNQTKGNRTQQLEALKIPKIGIKLVKSQLNKDDFLSNEALSRKIKELSFTIKGLRPLDEAISTVGGVSMDAITADFELKALSNHFCIGEMLNWDAPTGGYLLQACFSMGALVAQKIAAEGNEE